MCRRSQLAEKGKGPSYVRGHAGVPPGLSSLHNLTSSMPSVDITTGDSQSTMSTDLLLGV